MTLASRIVVLNRGRIEQVGTPLDLYHRPANQFVAGFLGSPGMNFLPAQMVSRHSQAVTVGVRPEHVTLCTSDDGLPAEVALIERLGGEALAHFRIETGGHAVVAKLSGDTALAAQDRVRLQVDTRHCHFFDRQGDALRSDE